MGNNVPSTVPSTYEEWIKKRVETLEADKTAQLNYLDQYQQTQSAALAQQKDIAVQGAQTERQRAYTDANTAYQQGLAHYGINAERLANMGLRGSGYSDYLTAAAYSTERAEKAAANAQERATAANAENIYYTGKQTLDDSVMKERNAINSTYSQMIDSAYGEALKYAEEKKTADAKSEIETMIAAGDGIGALLKGLNSGIYTADVVFPQLKTAFAVNPSDLSSFDFDGLVKVREFVDNGTLDASVYDDIVESYRDSFKPSNAFLNSGEEQMDFDEAEKAMKKYLKNIEVIGGEDAKEELHRIYKETYGILTNNNSAGESTTRDISGDLLSFEVFSPDGKKKNNYNVYVKGLASDSLGEEIASALLTRARNVGERKAFLYNGGLYFINNGKLYEIKDSRSAKGLKEDLANGHNVNDVPWNG